MANIVIGWNGRSVATPATYDENGVEITPEIPAETGRLKITGSGFFERILEMGQSTGISSDRTYTVEVIE